MRHGELLLALRYICISCATKLGYSATHYDRQLQRSVFFPPRSESTITRNHSNLQNSTQLTHVSYDTDLRPAATQCRTSYAFLDGSRPEAETNREIKKNSKQVPGC